MEFKSFKTSGSLGSRGLVWSPDGAKLANLATATFVRVLDATSGKGIHTLKGQYHAIATGVVWSPDGSKLAICSNCGGVRLWDAVTGEQGPRLRGIDEKEYATLYEAKVKLNKAKDYGPIRSIDWSLDGTKLAVGYGCDEFKMTEPVVTVKGWNVTTGQKIHALKMEDFPGVHRGEIWGKICDLDGLKGELFNFFWSPDGKQFVTVDEEQSEDGKVDNASLRVWDAYSRKEIHKLAGDAGSDTICVWSPDGLKLVTFKNETPEGTLWVWDVSSGKELYKIDLQAASWEGVMDVAWSPDGTRLASAGLADGTIKVWDALSGDKLYTLIEHTDNVFWVTWSPDGTKLASQSWGEVKIWDASCARSALHTLPASSYWEAKPAWSPDGRMFAAGGDPDLALSVRVWDAGTWEEIHTFIEEEEEVPEVVNEDIEAEELLCIAWSPDGGSLALGSGDYYSSGNSEVFHRRNLVVETSDFSVKVLEASNGEEACKLKGHEGSVHCLAWSPDGTRIASCSTDKTIRLWDPASGIEINKLVGHKDAVRSVAWSPDGKKLVSGSEDTLVKIWDASNGSELQTLKGHTGGVRSVAWSPDGKIIASGSWDNTVKLWDTSDGSEVHTLKGHKAAVRAVAWSPDGEKLATASKDNTIRIWSIPK